MDTNWKCRNSWILPGLHEVYSLKRGGFVWLVSVTEKYPFNKAGMEELVK